MKDLRSLPFRNLKHRPDRTILLAVLAAALAMCLCGGSLVTVSLSNGMQNLTERLGADIIVVPSSAKSKVNVDEILLNGTTGYFYMPKERFEEIAAVEGVEKASPQLFLASLKADCCAAAVQLIGIDQDTDFTIQPWINSRYSAKLGSYEVVAGCDIGAEAGETIKIYGKSCKVVAKLDKTGTGFDTAIYTSIDNIRQLMADAEALGINQKLTEDPDSVVSAVYIKVKDGYTVEKVTNNINIYVRKVEAVQTRNMITGVSDGLTAIASMARKLIVAIWVLCFAVLMLAFGMMTGERRSEFALLRMLGFSKRQLGRVVRRESLIISGMGGIAGAVLGTVVVYLFSDAIAAKLSLPFMAPEPLTAVLAAAGTIVLVLIAGLAASAWSAHRLAGTDTGILMREGH